MNRSVVLVADELSPAGLAVLAEDFDVRHVDGTDRAALLAALPEAQALIVRSSTQVDAEALEVADSLEVVARAGVGLDNIDVGAATKRGVMVVNAPQSNIVSAAEHAIALLLACARNIPQADSALKAGEWKRSKYTGTELHDKVVGIVGLGRIGVLVAQRLSAFGVKLIAYDPYISAARAGQLGVRLVGLDELLRESDFLTVHLPKTKETKGLIGERELSLVKPSAYVINAARGGIVEEDALAAALKDDRIAGAGVDVYASEPCTDSPLFGLPNDVVTPHLGASTREAQEKAGVAVARSVRLALAGELVPDAVNVQGGAIAEDVRPALPLVEKLGRLWTALAGGMAASLDVEVRGEIANEDVQVLQLAALKGIFADVVEDTVSYVNAPLLAQERNVEVNLVTSEESPEFRNAVTVRGTLPSGEVHSVSGTLAGHRHIEKLVEVDGYDVDIVVAEHMAFFRYFDRPGIVGIVGRLLGEAEINIAGMQVGRDEKAEHALVVMTVDSALSAELVSGISTKIGAEYGRVVDLSDV